MTMNHRLQKRILPKTAILALCAALTAFFSSCGLKHDLMYTTWTYYGEEVTLESMKGNLSKDYVEFAESHSSVKVRDYIKITFQNNYVENLGYEVTEYGDVSSAEDKQTLYDAIDYLRYSVYGNAMSKEGTWEIRGDTLIITYTQNDSGTFTATAVVSGDTLTLSNDEIGNKTFVLTEKY